MRAGIDGLNAITHGVIGAAVEVHRCLGPGLLESVYRVDLIVAGRVPIELKAVETLLPVHKAQLPTYLKLLDVPLGLLINFNVATLVAGVNRIANRL